MAIRSRTPVYGVVPTGSGEPEGEAVGVGDGGEAGGAEEEAAAFLEEPPPSASSSASNTGSRSTCNAARSKWRSWGTRSSSGR